MHSLFVFSLATLVLGLSGLVCGTLVNITIGDTNSLVSYQPPDHWAASPCPGCGVSQAVNASLAYGKSWHDATSTSPDDVRSVTVTFNGTAIYLFGIEPNFIPNGITTLSNVTFSLDGDFVGNYVHIPDSTPNVSYNVPIYANSSIPNGSHSITASIAAGSTDDKDHSLLLFNYAIYTEDDTPLPTTTSSSQLSTSTSNLGTSSPPSAPTSTASLQPKRDLPIGAIVGAAIGSQIIMVGALLLCWRHRRRRANSRRKFEDSPSVPQDYPRNFYTPAPAPVSTVGALSRFGGLDIQSTSQPRMAPPAYDTIQGPSALAVPAPPTASELEGHSAKEAYGAAPYTGSS